MCVCVCFIFVDFHYDFVINRKGLESSDENAFVYFWRGY